MGVVIGEFIGARQGLGYLIIYGSQVFKLDWVLMSIVILCIMAMGCTPLSERWKDSIKNVSVSVSILLF